MRVSVLIPAFRPTYLAQAIASVITQGHEDYELLICDDSGGEEVEAIVRRFQDPRIAYFRTGGRQGGGANFRKLWSLANEPIVKVQFDDDIMLPHALADLTDRLAADPTASFAFGHRDVVNESGRIIDQPRLIATDKAVPFGPGELGRVMLPRLFNRVGEFSNIVLNRAAGVTLDDVFGYRGFEIEMLVDVAFFLNASTKGPAIGIGRTVGQYRKHANQNSSASFNPTYAKVVGEWELFVRGEFSHGCLTSEQALQGVDRLQRYYQIFAPKAPPLLMLQAGLPTLREQVLADDRDTLSATFAEAWQAFDAEVQARVAAARA